MLAAKIWDKICDVKARVQAQLLCDGFNDFNQGLFVSRFGHMHEDCYSLWTCLKVQNQEGLSGEVSSPSEK